MANIAIVLKEEIVRLARKEIKAEIDAAKKALAGHKREIAALKQQVATLTKQAARIDKQVTKLIPEVEEPATPEKIRFTAKGFKSLRARLGLTAKELAFLLEISEATVGNWEKNDNSNPKQPQLVRIARLRKMGKKEVRQLLEPQQKQPQPE